ncbi:MAG: glutamate--tRNA ligase [Armatimonadota bacterium]|nr:glutamate--tRNA ligase [bacterium]
MSNPRVRFAPSPTGSPHIGNIRTAVFDYLFAEHTNGTFILRVEDTDRTRYVENSLEEMMAGLRWLGMQWDEGPEADGAHGPYFQSERLNLYHKYAQQLLDEGKAYYCYCSRERLEAMRKVQEAAKTHTGYDRKCRDLTPKEREERARECPAPVIRFKMALDGRTEFDDIVRGRVGFDNSLQDDFVMIKADGFPTYHFASIVDDHLMEITHVIRGEEWLSSAPKHVQLYDAFGWKPPVWVHLPLIMDTSGKKLSKRSGVSTAFYDYIENGYLPEAMLNFLATMGWGSGEDRKLYSRAELVEKFSLEGIANHPAIFDIAKLNDLNGEYIRMLSVDDLANMIRPRLHAAGYINGMPSEEELAYLKSVTSLIRDRLVTLAEAPEMVEFFYNDDFGYDEKGAKKHLSKETTPPALKSVSEKLAGLEMWDVESIDAAVRAAGVEHGLEGGHIIHPVRMAITGRTWGPGLFDLMQVIGQKKCVARLQRAASQTF